MIPKPKPADEMSSQDAEDSGIEFIDGGQGEDPYKILKSLYDDKDALEFKTDLSIREIKAVAIILFLADYVNLPEFKAFIKNVLKLKVSKDRKGRGEFIQAFAAIREDTMRSQNLKASLENNIR